MGSCWSCSAVSIIHNCIARQGWEGKWRNWMWIVNAADLPQVKTGGDIWIFLAFLRSNCISAKLKEKSWWQQIGWTLVTALTLKYKGLKPINTRILLCFNYIPWHDPKEESQKDPVISIITYIIICINKLGLSYAKHNLCIVKLELIGSWI